jgi:hypothetical protein
MIHSLTVNHSEDKPSWELIDLQVKALSDRLAPKQKHLFQYLIRMKKDERYIRKSIPPTGSTILREYFREYYTNPPEEDLGPPPDFKDAKVWRSLYQKGRQEATGLRRALQGYYDAWLANRIDDAIGIPGEETTERIVHIEIPKAKAFEPQITWLTRSQSPELEEFRYRGMSRKALEYLIERIPHATRIEDTTVRWNIAKSVYADMASFTAALAASNAVFKSITGPVQDEKYVSSLHQAYSGRPEGQIQCFRLHHAAPLMNFVLIYEDNKPWPEVLFGYGTQSRGREEETAVFSSNNGLLVKEFQRLFRVLQDEEFSREISIHDPEFLATRQRECDVLATFDNFPVSEIAERIEQCKKQQISICTTAWPTFDWFKDRLKVALENGCSVDLGLWEDSDPFVALRNAADLKLSIESNRTTLKHFEAHKNFHIHWCRGQGSVTIFRVGDVIYFSPYWVGEYASSGPHFMVYAASKTGKHLQNQFKKMIGTPKPPDKH